MRNINEMKEEINSFVHSLNEGNKATVDIDINEGSNNMAHYERIGNQTIVDSNFLNMCKGVISDSELVHLGMGDFMLKTSKGEITFNRIGKLVGIGDDFVGRPHRATDNRGGKLIDELVQEMIKKKKVNESEEDVFKPLDESIKVVLSELSNLKLDESIEDIEDITNLVTEINLKINDLRNAITDRQ